MTKMNGQNYVSFGTNTRMEGFLPFNEFHDQMLTLSNQYENCISVHSFYHPDEIVSVIDRTDTHQKNHNLSKFCFLCQWLYRGKR